MHGEEDDGVAYISYNLPAFYAYQPKFWHWLKLLWSILTGKGFHLFEVVLEPKEWQEFVGKMKEIKEAKG